MEFGDFPLIGSSCIRIDKSYYANANKGLLIVCVIAGFKIAKAAIWLWSPLRRKVVPRIFTKIPELSLLLLLTIIAYAYVEYAAVVGNTPIALSASMLFCKSVDVDVPE